MSPRFSLSSYATELSQLLSSYDWTSVEALGDLLYDCWLQRKTVFLCGNGGSAANAMHLAVDFLYGVNPEGPGLRVISLGDNSSILTCLGNDTGYDNIFAGQLKSQAAAGDLLIAFSGSGNSPNILKAIECAKSMSLQTAAILGFNGGLCKSLVAQPIHFPINDMQISEDIQQIVGHMLTLYLKERIQENG